MEEAKLTTPYTSEEDELKEALDDLKVIAELVVTPKTLDGTPIDQLGKGLPGDQDGMPCNVCDSAGYRENKRPVVGTCPECSGSGTRPHIFTCLSCTGSGKFTQRRALRVVDCRDCKGTGKFPHPTLTSTCRGCNGYKTIRVPDQFLVEYIKCSTCNGAGEVTPAFNPVLPRDIRKRMEMIRSSSSR